MQPGWFARRTIPRILCRIAANASRRNAMGWMRLISDIRCRALRLCNLPVIVRADQPERR